MDSSKPDHEIGVKGLAWAEQPGKRVIRLVVCNFLIAAAYWSTAVLVRGYFSRYQMWPAPLWVPAGISLSAVFVFGASCAPGIFLGSFLTNIVSFGGTAGSAVAVALGNTLAPIIAALLARHRIKLENPFARVSDVFVFSIVCISNGMLSALIGSSAIAMTVSAPLRSWPTRWLNWTISDAGASLLLVPVVLLLRYDPLDFRRIREHPVELLITLAVSVSSVMYLLSQSTGLLAVDAGSSFLILLPLLWIAVRFSSRLAYPILVGLMTVVIMATIAGHGPYSGVPTGGTFYIFAQMGIGFGVTVLLLGAVSEEHRTAEQALRELNQELETRVDLRTRELQESKKRLEQVAYHDPLTGLPNRRFLEERFAAARASAVRKGDHVAFLMIDLDHFKDINDTLGHDAGDELLIETGQKLVAAVREYDFVSRLGGDEFAVLLVDMPDHPQIETICTRIIEGLTDRIFFNGKDIGTSPSVGVALCPDHGDTWHEVYKAADLALYRAKRGGRGRWDWYRPERDAVGVGS